MKPKEYKGDAGNDPELIAKYVSEPTVDLWADKPADDSFENVRALHLRKQAKS